MTESLELPGARLAYDVAGEGSAIVLLHAWIADRRMWDPVVPALARRRRVVRYDARGFGETIATAAVPYSNRADLVALLDHLDIERAAVVGASGGGTIALDTALAFPDRVSAVVSVAGGISGFDGGSTPDEEPAFAESERLEEARDWDALVELEMRIWVDGLGRGPDRIPDVRRQVAEMDREVYRRHADDDLSGMTPLEPRATGRLRDVRTPALALVGELDTSGARATARRLAAEIPNVRLEVWPDVAHMPSMEHPERFVRLVEEFLDDVGA
ncbi:MAG TPA: alpha/beta hydrolase [Candidatus Limnocylindrales bacterium]